MDSSFASPNSQRLLYFAHHSRGCLARVQRSWQVGAFRKNREPFQIGPSLRPGAGALRRGFQRKRQLARIRFYYSVDKVGLGDYSNASDI